MSKAKALDLKTESPSIEGPGRVSQRPGPRGRRIESRERRKARKQVGHKGGKEEKDYR